MPNELAFTQVVKNDYFTHLQVNGTDTRFRAMEQIWNARGIVMRVQGGGDGGELNGFGKRHLLVSHDGTTGIQKATSVLNKRIGGKGASGREKKARDIVKAAVSPKSFGAGRDFNKTEFLQAQKSARTSLDREYSNGLYGPATNVCTFVLLNDLDPNQVKDAFADAIIDAGPWTASAEKAVHFLFDSAIVFELNADGSQQSFMGFSAQVKYTRGYYDIYHMNCGIEPA